MSSTPFPSPVTFFSPDSPEAARALAEALNALPGIPILGFLVKIVPAADGQEMCVNWQFADSTYLKALALVMPPGSQSQTDKE